MRLPNTTKMFPQQPAPPTASGPQIRRPLPQHFPQLRCSPSRRSFRRERGSQGSWTAHDASETTSSPTQARCRAPIRPTCHFVVRPIRAPSPAGLGMVPACDGRMAPRLIDATTTALCRSKRQSSRLGRRPPQASGLGSGTQRHGRPAAKGRRCGSCWLSQPLRRLVPFESNPRVAQDFAMKMDHTPGLLHS